MAEQALTRDLIRLQAENADIGILPPGTKFDSYIGHTVINISNTPLSQVQISAFEKGLTFCPTPGPQDKSQTWLDFKEFHRRLELTYHFHNTDTNENLNIDHSIVDFMNQNAKDSDTDSDTNTIPDQTDQHIKHKFVNKSTWRPDPPNKTLETFQRSFKQDLLKYKKHKHKGNNLNKEERKGLKELNDNPHIIIKKADKGSAVVVMNTTDYLREGYRQLSDKNFYQKVDNDQTNYYSDKIAQVLLDMRSPNLLTEKNFDYLNVSNPKEASCYLLPKIHKNKISGRPICSSINHPTSNIS